MAGFFNLVNEWTIRAVVVLSLGSQIILVLFAGVRRREASGWRTLVLWLAYQVADWAAPYALSNLSRSSMSRQQQLVAFWMPFLLTHLGGPDNITAYSLEDNKLSMRQAVSTVLQLLGTSFVIYREIYVSGAEGTLLWASIVMVAVGVAKYFERALALREGDFGNIRSSARKRPISLNNVEPPAGRRRQELLNNDQALLLAHELLHITKGAFADYSVDDDPLKRGRGTKRKRLFPYGSGKNMRKVVEMELSLMYDILYTKAAATHTWGGYLMRVTSLITTASVTMLFWLHSKNGERRADVIITYILLVISFLLEVWWLLRATASTWTYAFLNARPSCWLHHELLCTGRWHRFRQLVVLYLNPQRLLLRESSGGYRLWSGTIGQYNLLHECTHHDKSSLWSRLVKKLATEDIWMEYQYSKALELHQSEFEQLLFLKIEEALKLVDMAKKKKEEEPLPMLIGTTEPDAAFKRRRRLDEALGFFPEFQELILIWHVATDIFLLANHEHFGKNERDHVEAIKALSNYMTFLAAVRSDMLPGLKLRSLYDVTRQALERIFWNENVSTSRRTNGATRDEDLASILRMRNKKKLPSKNQSVLHDSSVILSDATKYAEVLLECLRPSEWDEIIAEFEISKDSEKRILFLIPRLEKDDVFRRYDLLEKILESWIRMLIFVSTRCGRDSHAKQLSRGCDLTTIVWILAEHAGIFSL